MRLAPHCDPSSVVQLLPPAELPGPGARVGDGDERGERPARDEEGVVLARLAHGLAQVGVQLQVAAVGVAWKGKEGLKFGKDNKRRFGKCDCQGFVNENTVQNSILLVTHSNLSKISVDLLLNSIQ